MPAVGDTRSFLVSRPAFFCRSIGPFKMSTAPGSAHGGGHGGGLARKASMDKACLGKDAMLDDLEEDGDLSEDVDLSAGEEEGEEEEPSKSHSLLRCQTLVHMNSDSTNLGCGSTRLTALKPHNSCSVVWLTFVSVSPQAVVSAKADEGFRVAVRDWEASSSGEDGADAATAKVAKKGRVHASSVACSALAVLPAPQVEQRVVQVLAKRAGQSKRRVVIVSCSICGCSSKDALIVTCVQ